MEWDACFWNGWSGGDGRDRQNINIDIPLILRYNTHVIR